MTGWTIIIVTRKHRIGQHLVPADRREKISHEFWTKTMVLERKRRLALDAGAYPVRERRIGRIDFR